MKYVVLLLCLCGISSAQVGHARITSDTTGMTVFIDGADVGKLPVDKTFTLTIGTHAATIFPPHVQSETNRASTGADNAMAYSIGNESIIGAIVAANQKSKGRKYREFISRGTATFLIQPEETTVVYLPVKKLVSDIRLQAKDEDTFHKGLFVAVFAVIVAIILTTTH